MNKTLKNNYPSIFNDVIGPVMRGPSSSHCAAAVRIGLLVRDIMDGAIQEVSVEFDPKGSLASTHESQGSDMGLFAGLLGWDVTDERMTDSLQAIHKAGIHVDIQIRPIGAEHPNTYRITACNGQEIHRVTAVSIGGGIIEFIEIDGINVSISGDYFETLIFMDADGAPLLAYLKENIPADEIQLQHGQASQLVIIKTQQVIDREVIAGLRFQFAIQSIKQLSPVLPILSRKDVQVPFTTSEEMLTYNRDRYLDLGELAICYESERGAIPHDAVMKKMVQIIGMMQNAIDAGLAGTQYSDRILGFQSGGFQTRMDNHKLIDAGVLNRIILYTTALMESKSSMGLIVAAPTAGACGGLPGACIGTGNAMGLSSADMARAMLAGGIIGIFISIQATFAAEVGGCQAECGAGSGMAAAALVTLAGGSAQQAVSAASMALQNILGMICDPVAKRVEVPCLGKNVLAASNALACANMALSDYDPVIPLDEVLDTMNKVGRMLPRALCCTGLGGLSTTKTSQDIESRLKGSHG